MIGTDIIQARDQDRQTRFGGVPAREKGGRGVACSPLLFGGLTLLL